MNEENYEKRLRFQGFPMTRCNLVAIFAELHTGRTDYTNLRPKAWAARLAARTA